MYVPVRCRSRRDAFSIALPLVEFRLSDAGNFLEPAFYSPVAAECFHVDSHKAACRVGREIRVSGNGRV